MHRTSYILFKEKVSLHLWIAIGFITLSSIVLSFESADSFQLSLGSLFVLLATCCWGLENNCTRMISSKSTYEIVFLKGLFSGLGSFVIALVLHETFPALLYVLYALVLGFVAYGLSIFLYIRAQRDLGAAKTSAYYAVAPFIGAFLAFMVNGEQLTGTYFVGLLLMGIGTAFVIYDTLVQFHNHRHTHIIVHTHNGITHTHVLEHEHEHHHFVSDKNHKHRHDDFMKSKEHTLEHLKENE